MGAAPLTPFIKPCQNSAILLPIGVSAHKPVTTTRFKIILIYFIFDKTRIPVHLLGNFYLRDKGISIVYD